MSQKSTALNAISLPLNQVNLIEASAGTGKTYTIGSIYLRLLLQAGEKLFFSTVKCGRNFGGNLY